MVWIIIAFIIYCGVMIVIGGVFYGKSDTVSDYFLGGRTLNPWVAGLSAQASDMSGWLLMGLPGAVYAAGTGQIWIAVGLCIGTLLNWVFVAGRLREYTIKFGDSITLPEYFQKRFDETGNVLRGISAVFIAIFFAVYTASAFVAAATLFEQVLGIDYHIALLIGVLIILVYTFLGGFSAVCWTDLIQGILMFVAILAVPIIALLFVNQTGGFEKVDATFFDVFKNVDGSHVGAVSIISQLAWGLGYFGMPHILIRFMAIRKQEEVKTAGTIAGVWVVFSLIFAVVLAIIGKVFVPDLKNSETVFIEMIKKIFLADESFILIQVIGGFFICGILAAIMSTADSQLLVTASAITNDIYGGMIHKKATEKSLVIISRGVVFIIAVVGFVIALDRSSSVMGLVSNAWAGFGACFGPLVLCSLYFKRITKIGAVVGMLSGGITVIIWDYIPLVNSKTLGEATGLYSLIVGFGISLVLLVVCSLLKQQGGRS